MTFESSSRARTRRMVYGSIAAAILSALLSPASGQIPASSWPPRVLLIESVRVQPGQMAAFEMQIKKAIQERAKRSLLPRIGMISTTGPIDEAVFLVGFDTVSQLESELLSIRRSIWGEAITGEAGQSIVVATRRRIALLREDLGVKPATLDLVEFPFMAADEHVVRTGERERYEIAVRESNAKVKPKDSGAARCYYDVVSGDPPGAMLILEPLKSVAELQPSGPANGQRGHILGPEFKDLLVETETLPRTALYILRPGLSYSRR